MSFEGICEGKYVDYKGNMSLSFLFQGRLAYCQPILPNMKVIDLIENPISQRLGAWHGTNTC